MTQPLLSIDELSVDYRGRRRSQLNRAVDRISLRVDRGETVGLVGESGSGKTSIGAATLGLVPVAGGRIWFDGEDITHSSRSRRRALSADLQVIFQDPYGSLNPSRTVGQTLVEPLLVQRNLRRGEKAELVKDMLTRVGLDPDVAGRYPSQFSGGQRQRIAVARALIVSPRLVICDEAVSALDLSIQAQVLNLLLSLQSEFALSFLFISHDLSVVRHMSQRIVVLYHGRVMESGRADQVYGSPGHPYTQALLSAIPVPDPVEQRRRRRRAAPTPERLLTPHTSIGCPFKDRCPFVIDRCRVEMPELIRGPTGSLVACHRRDEVGFGSSSIPEEHTGRAVT
jgi:oligopeptide/dipeptide ABC transporter ATP-binding protein